MKFNSEILDRDESGGGKSSFVKLKDKEFIDGIFMGSIREFHSIWTDGKTSEVPKGTPGSSFRFRVNFMVKEGTVYTPKMFEQGLTVYRDLAQINNVYPLETIVIRITRNGSTKSDTSYNLLPLLMKPIPPETLAHLKTIPLLPLEAKKEEAAVGRAPVKNYAPGADANDLPF